jgi:hypothetical protein
MDVLTLDDDFGTVSIPAGEYEALTHLESQVRRMAARRTPVDRACLSTLLERIRWARQW